MHEHLPRTLQEAINTCKIVNIKAGTFFNFNGSKFQFYLLLVGGFGSPDGKSMCRFQ